MNLRWIKREDKEVLQRYEERNVSLKGYHDGKWIDIPFETIEERPKRTLNFRIEGGVFNPKIGCFDMKDLMVGEYQLVGIKKDEFIVTVSDLERAMKNNYGPLDYRFKDFLITLRVEK